MPQLDRTIIFPQIFWFFIIFIIFYIIILHFILPKFVYSLKLRKELVLLNIFKTNEISNKISRENTILISRLNLHLNLIQKSIYFNNTRINTIFLNKEFTNPVKLQNKLLVIIRENILFCNKHILNIINLYPINLNLN